VPMNTQRLLKFVSQLRDGAPINCNAVAFILTEMRFRGVLFRICEVVYALWTLYALRREPQLTLGKCQVSFKYWRAYAGTNNWKLFRAAFNDMENYKVCCEYLRINSRANLREIIIGYNGRPSTLYVRLFYKNLESLNWAVRHLARSRHTV
jgi:hypothetical protein